MRLILACGVVCIAAAMSLNAAPCATGSFTSYMALGNAGCQVGDFTFSHFDWLVGITNLNANSVTTDDITVTATDGGNAGPSINFAGDWHTNDNLSGSSYTATLLFRVDADFPFEKLLDSNQLSVIGDASGGLVALATITEVNCLGGVLNPTLNLCLSGGVTANAVAGVSSVIPSIQLNAAVNPFDNPVSTIDVVKNLTLTATPNLSNVIAPLYASASISSITESFGVATPEPATWLLLSSSLLLFLLIRRGLTNPRS